MLPRRALLGAAAAGVAGGLVGCSSENSASPTSTSSPIDVPGTPGPLRLNAIPTRVVSVGQYRDTDAAVGLGVVPVASPDLSSFVSGGMTPWVKEKVRDAPPELFDATELPYEKIAALAPDLILASDRSALADEYERLTKIAPTLAWGRGYNSDPWQLTTQRVGQALGRTEAADALVRSTEAAVATARSDHPRFDQKTFTLGPVTADGVINTINSATDSSATFMSQLGLKLSDSVTSLPKGNFPGRAVVSLENLDLIEADVVLLTFNTPAARARLESQSVFKRLPAVRRGAYVPLDLTAALAIGFPSALSIGYALRTIVPQLAAVLER